MTRKVSDADFIAAWQANPSPERLAETLGLSVRNIYRRRQSLEKRHCLNLPSAFRDMTGRLDAAGSTAKIGDILLLLERTKQVVLSDE